MIRVNDLRFAHTDEKSIFDGFHLRVAKGEAWTIIGPSGCGKTTLLFLVAGLTAPLSGEIVVGGVPIKRPRPATGLVLQDHGLLPWATIDENTRLGLRIRKLYGPDGKHSPRNVINNAEQEQQRIDHWLGWLGIDHLREKYPGQLSRGQRQRAAIARTLVLEPDLLLMDEPFSALDLPIREELQKVMNNFHKQSGLTSLTVTHDIEEAVVLGEKILVLTEGCNRRPEIVDNPRSGAESQRGSDSFKTTCNTLRRLLGMHRGTTTNTEQRGAL
ncbi:MAG: ABC transporter ATP-binding protein [Deltaproteobacteria bacterium]|nr:MAG: ABC transporter ATP-binding protein [Deltaproteobacteria bacterium]